MRHHIGMPARVSSVGSLVLVAALAAFARADDAELVARAGIDLVKAIQIAEERVPGAGAIEAKLDEEKDSPIYEITLLSGDARHEMKVHGVTGDVMVVEQNKLREKHVSLRGAMATFNTSLRAVIADAMSRAGQGTPIEAELEIDDAKLVGTVKVLTGKEDRKIEIPFGDVLAAREDDDIDRDDDDDEEEVEVDDEEERERRRDVQPPRRDPTPPPVERRPRSAEAWDFDRDEVGALPGGWVVRETAPTSAPATWKVMNDPSAPSGPHVLALAESRNYAGTVNLALFDRAEFQDVDLTVDLRIIGGTEEQGGGLVWRAVNANNYYYCHANANAGVVRVYQVVDGHRSKVVFALVAKEPDRWHQLRVTMVGDTITCYLNGIQVASGTDATHRKPGRIGLATLADATTSFDNFIVRHHD